MRPHRTRFLSIAAVTAAAAILAACSSGGSSSTTSASNSKPIVIGASVSLTGDFSADGQAFQRGYKLWASDVNKAGGLMGRKVKLIFLDDKSDPTQGSTNVQQLISSDHVNLLFGPFSSLITGPTASVGPLVFSSVGSADETVSYLPASRAGELCGRRLDWIEAVPG